MTREEAIEMLKKDKEQRGNCFISDALGMAIKALEQQPCEAFEKEVRDKMPVQISPHLERTTYGYCIYHGIECDYKGSCIDCPHNTEWFKQDEEKAEGEG